MQKTLASEFTISGKGLHTSCLVTAVFKPAPENHGFKFKRVDVEGQPIIDADALLVNDTARGTVLVKDDVRLSTIEHALAALTGMDLDNVLIEIDNEEMPIVDGSAKPFVEAIAKAGIIEQKAERKYFSITEKISYKDEKTGAEIMILPDDTYSLNTLISFNSSVLNNQFASLDSLDNFKDEIAPCRTFVFVRELEFLLQHNLVKGGDLDSAIVIMDKNISEEELARIASLFSYDGEIKVQKSGILNNLDLQFDNECARHKLLDVVGDLALAGVRLKGKVIATKPGHGVNTKLAQLIRKAYIAQEKEGAPVYDDNATPQLDINQIREKLPHRYPFLLVDKVMEINEEHIIGIKNVTGNEPFFEGHFPDEPVMPGVLLIEAMAQCGGLYVLNDLDGEYSTYFIRVNNVRFRHKVVPGDTLKFRLKLTTPIRRGIANMAGQCFVGNTLVAEGEFTAQISKKQ